MTLRHQRPSSASAGLMRACLAALVAEQLEIHVLDVGHSRLVRLLVDADHGQRRQERWVHVPSSTVRGGRGVRREVGKRPLSFFSLFGRLLPHSVRPERFYEPPYSEL